MKTEINNFNIEIHIKINEKKQMLAQCSVTISGIGEIRGYRVMVSKFDDGLNVVPPAPNNMPTYHLVRLEPSLWEELKKAIKQAYLEVKEINSTMPNRENIDPSEIPI